MRYFSTIVLTVLVLASLSMAHAAKDKKEDTHRSVQGLITDGNEAPAVGAVVQLKDMKSLQIRSFITKENGLYHFNGLSPDNDYELKAEHHGVHSNSKRLSSFDGRKAAVINIKVDK